MCTICTDSAVDPGFYPLKCPEMCYIFCCVSYEDCAIESHDYTSIKVNGKIFNMILK